MKRLQLILILAIIAICFTDDTIDCESRFQEILKSKCAAIDSCTLNDYDNSCQKTKECSNVDVNTESCVENIPPKFFEQKCELNSEDNACESTPRLCSDFGKFGDGTVTTISGDDCTNLTPPANEGNRCVLDGVRPYLCNPHFDD